MVKNKIEIGKIVSQSFPNKSQVQTENSILTAKGGILGQEVEIKKTRRTKAKILNILKKSELETIEGCIHSDDCGGCTYQTLKYQDELKLKENLLKDLFAENEIEIKDFEILPSPLVEEYRNKMEYTFSDEYKDGPLSLGLHQKNKFYEVVNTTHCNIVSKDFNTIRSFTREYFDGKQKPYNKVRHDGYLRHLLIRRTSTKEIMVNLVTTFEEVDLKDYFEKLKNLKLEGKIVSILHTKNDSLSDAIVPEEVELIYGRDYIVEEILGLKFKITSFSFFQTNTKSAEKLYSLAKKTLGDMKEKIFLDLYSGTGTITQIIGKDSKKALGIEIIEEAVKSARENTQLNNIDNVEFICGDVFEEVKKLEYKADIIVLDPPREGINPKAIEKIISFNPEKFLYISCNPQTLARDLKEFISRGYEIKTIKALDQFPRTYHLECVVLLETI